MMFLNQVWMCVLVLVPFSIKLVSIEPCFILFESFMLVLKCCLNVQRWMNNKNLPNQTNCEKGFNYNYYNVNKDSLRYVCLTILSITLQALKIDIYKLRKMKKEYNNLKSIVK
jgi:hypothetical protein